jgi:hypothetical protein
MTDALKPDWRSWPFCTQEATFFPFIKLNASLSANQEK